MTRSWSLSPGSSPWGTNRTNQTRSSGGKYESALFSDTSRIVVWGATEIAMTIESASNSWSNCMRHQLRSQTIMFLLQWCWWRCYVGGLMMTTWCWWQYYYVNNIILYIISSWKTTQSHFTCFQWLENWVPSCSTRHWLSVSKLPGRETLALGLLDFLQDCWIMTFRPVLDSNRR